jgi:hypothetical protein
LQHDATSDRVKCADRWSAIKIEASKSGAHLGGGLASKSDGKSSFKICRARGNAPRDTSGENSGFARSGTGSHDNDANGGSDGGALFGIEPSQN